MKKLNLLNINGNISRLEMRSIMAGYGGSGSCPITCSGGGKICDSANGCRCNVSSDTCHTS